ncbi:hypothetical protein Ga0074812_10442 [Parafrankia irregularis]|uniref:Uncharacterized protein n=1 Tax=Parafrankia irregularis TaxID=795642 RepID=A0A0S4QIM4_9ACTN|nr:hypothetical protein Ga0074812_10442 [Parafrankia irregularis]
MGNGPVGREIQGDEVGEKLNGIGELLGSHRGEEGRAQGR